MDCKYCRLVTENRANHASSTGSGRHSRHREECERECLDPATRHRGVVELSVPIVHRDPRPFAPTSMRPIRAELTAIDPADANETGGVTVRGRALQDDGFRARDQFGLLFGPPAARVRAAIDVAQCDRFVPNGPAAGHAAIRPRSGASGSCPARRPLTAAAATAPRKPATTGTCQCPSKWTLLDSEAA